MMRGLILAAIAVAPCSAACAATLDGVTMRTFRVVDGTPLRLNGIGLRTYSILGIRIYVAGLYLERYSDDFDSTCTRPKRSCSIFGFCATSVWLRPGKPGRMASTTIAVCRRALLDPRDVERFLAEVPPIHRGDETVLLFTSKGVTATFNGRTLGEITDHHFAETLLATFIGPVPPTPRLKRELLGEPD